MYSLQGKDCNTCMKIEEFYVAIMKHRGSSEVRKLLCYVRFPNGSRILVVIHETEEHVARRDISKVQ